MNALYDLRDMLCAQLEDYGKKGELSASVLEKVDTLAHATKNLDKIIDKCEGEEEEYSGEWQYGPLNKSGRRSRRSYGSYRGSSRNSSRRSMNSRHSGDDREEDDELVDQVYSMMDNTTDEKTRQELQRFANRMEQR